MSLVTTSTMQESKMQARPANKKIEERWIAEKNLHVAFVAGKSHSWKMLLFYKEVKYSFSTIKKQENIPVN